jgi:hypothetical protein
MTYEDIVACDKVSTKFITLNSQIGTGLSEIFLANTRLHMKINLIDSDGV